MKNRNDDWDREEPELDELDLEEWDQEEPYEWDEDNDSPDNQNPLKMSTVVLVFLGLVVLAALICGILWNITHGDKKGGAGSEVNQGVTSDSEKDSENGTDRESGAAADSGRTDAASEDGQDSGLDSDGGNGGESSPGEDFETTDQNGGSASQTPPEAEESHATQTPPEAEESHATQTPPETEESHAPQTTPEAEESHAPQTTPEAGSTSGTTASANANRVSTLDGRVIVFTDCDDTVTPKEYVNLRLEPSTTEGNATVHCVLNYGETVHRTGISEDSGWSRVEKDGVVCYVVTSLVYVTE